MSRFAVLSSGLFALIAGCGDDGAARPADAPPPPDGDPDAPTIGDVTVMAHARCCNLPPLTPEEGVIVAVVQPDGTLGETATTDASGVATLTGVHTGATVAALYPENVDYQTYLTTFSGVKPGDRLTVGHNYYAPSAAGTEGAITVEVPSLSGYQYLNIFAPCGGSFTNATTAVTLPLYDSCQTPTAAVLFLALDAGYIPIASGFLPDAPYTNGAVVSLPAWTPSQDFTVSMTGVGATISYADLHVVAAYPRWPYYRYGAAQRVGSMMTGTVLLPTTAPRTYASASLNHTLYPGNQRAFHAGASPLTFEAPKLPWITSVTVDAVGRRVAWSTTPGAFDAVTVRLSWDRYDGGGNYHYYEWNAVLPPGTEEIALAELAPTLPHLPTDQLYGDVRLIDLASASSYDALRAAPEWVFADPESAVAYGDEASAATTYDGAEGFASLAPRR